MCVSGRAEEGEGEERWGTGEGGGGWRAGGRLPAGIDMRLSGVQIHTFVHLAILLPI
jgi:hypothetical protein